MFAPAGYFCSACPTVIVGESLIATGLKEGYRFRAVVGVDSGVPLSARRWRAFKIRVVLAETIEAFSIA